MISLKPNSQIVIPFFSNTLKFAGIGESSVAEKINDLLNLKNPTVAPYANLGDCLLYTSPSPRDYAASRMPSSA